MMRTLSIMRAFLVRDAKTAARYRFAFAMRLAGALAYLFVFFYISRILDESETGRFEAYGGRYFNFVLIGIAFLGFLRSAMAAFSAEIRSAQVMGTLEAIMVTPVSIGQFLCGTGVVRFGLSSLRVIGLLLLGGLLFQVDFSGIRVGAALLVLLLSVASFGALGILSGAFILVFKKGDPVTLFMQTASALLGGVFFPVDLLPAWLERISALLPITWAARAMRSACLAPGPGADLSTDLQALALFALVLLPCSLWAFHRAIEKARRDGSLSHY